MPYIVAYVKIEAEERIGNVKSIWACLGRHGASEKFENEKLLTERCNRPLPGIRQGWFPGWHPGLVWRRPSDRTSE